VPFFTFSAAVSLALLRLNWHPARLFVGDTYCYVTQPAMVYVCLSFFPFHTYVGPFFTTHPGVGGGTLRRRATFDRCEMRGVVFRVVVCGVVLVLCLLCDLFLCLQDLLCYVCVC